jgi:DNA-binding MarR family transcriptional regulator
MSRLTDPPHPGVIALLSQLTSRAEEIYAKGIKTLKLTPVQGRALLILLDEAPISQKVLAQRLGIYASRLVRIVDALESSRLIEREANPQDRRAFELRLTSRGGNKASAVSHLVEQQQDMVCSPLTGAERAKLVALLSRMLAA